MSIILPITPMWKLGIRLICLGPLGFVAQYTYSSGSRTPGGSQDGNFDILFGARRFDLNPTGIWGAFARSNISTPGWRLILTPCR